MWILIVSFCISVSLVMSLVFCLCWRKKIPKNEWLGVDGMVTQKNPDENVNHLPSAAVVTYIADDVNANGDNVDAAKRSTGVTNTRRSLPDIPSDQCNNTNWEPTGDNSSEHYATVGQCQTNKRHTLPNGGVEARPSISQHSSLSQADDAFSPYERVKYDLIKSNKEHPYAQVQPTTSRSHEETQEEHSLLIRSDRASSSSEPSVPPRSRRSSAQSTLMVNIPAASAVAGGIAASPELPYMTPPVAQTNFSGDSQDSSKGYTSITVREPLATILAQTKEMNKKREFDQHYSTVSDDSDDVYTTIPDPNNQIYTSESETYAHIPAHPVTVEAEVNVPSRLETEEDNNGLYEAPPQQSQQQPTPPSVDSLKHVAAHTTHYSHSRQASSSSSVANLGSPKPEKRQANSPLPPTPTGTSFDFHPTTDKQGRNLDDLYAKVHKNKRKESSDEEVSPPENNTKHVVEEQPPVTNSTAVSIESKPSDLNHHHHKEIRRREHEYETLKRITTGTTTRKCSDPGYEKIKQQQQQQEEEPGYASINGPESINSSDPGYEILKADNISTDPAYEELRNRGTFSENGSTTYYKTVAQTNNNLYDGYSVVNKQKPEEKSVTSSSYTTSTSQEEPSLDEPNYESMPSESLSSDPNYSAIRSTGSESDPNYESVKYLDEEPPYERLDEDSSSYEKVGNANLNSPPNKSEPPYEHIKRKLSDSVSGYEELNLNATNNSNTSEEECCNYSVIKKNNVDQNKVVVAEILNSIDGDVVQV